MPMYDVGEAGASCLRGLWSHGSSSHSNVYASWSGNVDRW